MKFHERALEVEEEVFDFLLHIMRDEGRSIRLRVECAMAILSRSSPSVRAVEIKNVSPVTIIYNSPQIAAAEVYREIKPRRALTNGV